MPQADCHSQKGCNKERGAIGKAIGKGCYLQICFLETFFVYFGGGGLDAGLMGHWPNTAGLFVFLLFHRIGTHHLFMQKPDILGRRVFLMY